MSDFYDKVAHDERNEYLKHQNPTHLLTNLLDSNKNQDDKIEIASHINNALNDLRNSINRK